MARQVMSAHRDIGDDVVGPGLGASRAGRGRLNGEEPVAPAKEVGGLSSAEDGTRAPRPRVVPPPTDPMAVGPNAPDGPCWDLTGHVIVVTEFLPGVRMRSPRLAA